MTTYILVDNSNGAHAQFASDLQVALTAAGFEVELREPSPLALYDTSVHFVVDGVAIRLQDDPRQVDLAAIAQIVRETEARRPQRASALPRRADLRGREQPRADVGGRVRLKPAFRE